MKRQSRYGRLITGFTLVELVVTMIVIGILAVAILPRFASVNIFESRGYLDQATSLLQFAQKAAVARHQMVYVDLASVPPKLCASASATPTCANAATCATTIPLPGGAYKQPSTSVTISASSPKQVCFDALGSPYDSSGAKFTSQKSIIINDASNATVGTIKIEQETGYVHD